MKIKDFDFVSEIPDLDDVLDHSYFDKVDNDSYEELETDLSADSEQDSLEDL